MNENAITETNAIVAAYNAATGVDNSAVIAAQLERLSGFAVTDDPDNIQAAKKTRTRLNFLAKDASEPRMAVQRAIKAHPIGAFAFTKSDLEKEIEKESKRLGDDIARVTNAPKVRLEEKVDTFVCFVTGTLAQVNRLAVAANEMGMAFENHGPAGDAPRSNADGIV